MFLAPAAFNALTSSCEHMINRCFWWSRPVRGTSPDEACGCRGEARFVPSQQQEWAAEDHFAKSRAGYRDGKLSVKSYRSASAKQHRITMEKFADLSSVDPGASMSYSKKDWERIDQNAIRYAASLFAHCSRQGNVT